MHALNEIYIAYTHSHKTSYNFLHFMYHYTQGRKTSSEVARTNPAVLLAALKFKQLGQKHESHQSHQYQDQDYEMRRSTSSSGITQ